MHESEKWKCSRSVVSNSVRPHGLQTTRLLRPWDFPGKSTGVGQNYFKCTIYWYWIDYQCCTSTSNIHFQNLFIVPKWNLLSHVHPTLWDPVDYTVHGILQARILEWVAFAFSRGSSQPRYWNQVSCIAGGFFTCWATREAKEYCSG